MAWLWSRPALSAGGCGVMACRRKRSGCCGDHGGGLGNGDRGDAGRGGPAAGTSGEGGDRGGDGCGAAASDCRFSRDRRGTFAKFGKNFRAALAPIAAERAARELQTLLVIPGNFSGYTGFCSHRLAGSPTRLIGSCSGAVRMWTWRRR